MNPAPPVIKYVIEVRLLDKDYSVAATKTFRIIELLGGGRSTGGRYPGPDDGYQIDSARLFDHFPQDGAARRGLLVRKELSQPHAGRWPQEYHRDLPLSASRIPRLG